MYGIIFILILILFIWLFIINRSAKCCKTEEEKCLQYKQTNLSSNVLKMAQHIDTGAKNSWGLVKHKSYSYVSQNGSGLLSQYNKCGSLISHINIPPAPGGETGSPSGLTYNCHTNSFIIADGGNTGAAQLVIVTEDGLICGYSSLVNSSDAVIMVDASTSNKVFKGCTILENELFVTNFSDGVIERYDSSFNFINSFTDTGLTNTKYAPFNILNVCQSLYVTFALQNTDKKDDVSGPGNGYIDVFKSNGTLSKRLVNRGLLNSPWGLSYDKKCHLIVGNFGDGKIHQYNVHNGKCCGTLIDCCENELIIDGLWGFVFSNGKIYFAAGPNSENDGLFGVLS